MSSNKSVKEIWKDIPNYEGYYQVSNLGNVKSLPRVVKDKNRERTQAIKGKIMQLWDNGNGYQVVSLLKNGKRKNYYVHILVAKNFIDNSYNLEEVNHKNLNKKDNTIFNLEWISSIDNKRHYSATEIAKNRKKLES